MFIIYNRENHMDIEEPAHEDNEQDNTSKFHLSNQANKKFNIELSVSQANALEKILPRGYSFQVQRQIKNKRTGNKKKTNTVKKQLINNAMDIEQPSERMIKTKSAQRYNEDLVNLSNYSRAASQNYYEEIDDFMKPCLRILHMLKNHKTAWPFKQPVDPIGLNIPNYLQIIKQPMDLQTVQKNLKSKVYATPTQFHADIGKIIRNSYEFNKNNADFCKLTSEFQQYYNKITSDSSANRSITYQNPNINSQTSLDLKKVKSKKPITKAPEPRFREPSQTQAVTLAQKKMLTQQIKKLPRQYLKQVIQIVYEGKSPQAQQLNIDNLPTAKIRQLQRYVRDKASYLQMNSNNERSQEPQRNQGARGQESSFESDSES